MLYSLFTDIIIDYYNRLVNGMQIHWLKALSTIYILSSCLINIFFMIRKTKEKKKPFWTQEKKKRKERNKTV